MIQKQGVAAAWATVAEWVPRSPVLHCQLQREIAAPRDTPIQSLLDVTALPTSRTAPMRPSRPASLSGLAEWVPFQRRMYARGEKSSPCNALRIQVASDK